MVMRRHEVPALANCMADCDKDLECILASLTHDHAVQTDVDLLAERQRMMDEWKAWVASKKDWVMQNQDGIAAILGDALNVSSPTHAHTSPPPVHIIISFCWDSEHGSSFSSCCCKACHCKACNGTKEHDHHALALSPSYKLLV